MNTWQSKLEREQIKIVHFSAMESRYNCHDPAVTMKTEATEAWRRKSLHRRNVRSSEVSMVSRHSGGAEKAETLS